MKNIVIVLVSIAILAAVGFMATAEIARQVQNRQQAADEAKVAQATAGSAEGMQQAGSSLNVAMENLRRRQNYAMIGGGVGAAVGLVAGIGITAGMDRRRRKA